MHSRESSVDPLDSDGYDPSEGYQSPQQYAASIGSGTSDTSPDTENKPEMAPKRAASTGSSGTVLPPPTWRETLGFVKTVLVVYALLMCLFMGALSIYWGSFYERESRFKNMKTLLLNLDSPVNANGTTVDGFGRAFHEMVQQDAWVKENFGFEVMDKEDVVGIENVTEMVYSRIRREHYWGAIIVGNNVTGQLYEAMATANASAAAQISSYITYMYEPTRHLAAFNSYYLKNARQLEGFWINDYCYEVYNDLLASLSPQTRLDLARNNDTLKLLTIKPTLNTVTVGVTASSISIGPSQLGLIYAQLFTIYQYSFFQKIYGFIQPKVSFNRYVFLRWLASNVNSMVLSLVYCLATLAFQVPVNLTFGQSGFVVLWMVMFLFILANALINETVFAIATFYKIPWLIGPFSIFNAVLNLTTAFFPLAVSPKFFRFGYALPMHNAFELVKVVFFDTWKGHMGANFGVLFAWVVIGSATSIGALYFIRHKEQDKKKVGNAF